MNFDRWSSVLRSNCLRTQASAAHSVGGSTGLPGRGTTNGANAAASTPVKILDDAWDVACPSPVCGVSVAWSSAPEVTAPPELRTTTPGAGSFVVSVDPVEPADSLESMAWSGSDESSDPDQASTEPAPADGVDPLGDTTPSSVFESGPPRAGLSTSDASADGSDVGSAAAMPGWVIVATPTPSATARTPAHRAYLVLLTARAPCRRPFRRHRSNDDPFPHVANRGFP